MQRENNLEKCIFNSFIWFLWNVFIIELVKKSVPLLPPANCKQKQKKTFNTYVICGHFKIIF